MVNVSLGFNQAGTSAPVIVNQVNNTGATFTPSRGGAGQYFFTPSTAIFAIGNHLIIGGGYWDGGGNPYIPLSDGSTIVGYMTVYTNSAALPNNNIQVDVVNTSFVPTDLSALIGNTTVFLPLIVFP